MPVSSVWRWSHRHKARASFCMLIKEAYTKANCVKIYQQGFKNHLFDEDGHICQVFGDCGTGRSKGLKNKLDIWLTSKWCAHCNDWWWFGCRITWTLKWQNKWKFIHVVNESQWERKDFSDEQCKKIWFQCCSAEGVKNNIWLNAFTRSPSNIKHPHTKSQFVQLVLKNVAFIV